jgi:hypothetical protein
MFLEQVVCARKTFQKSTILFLSVHPARTRIRDRRFDVAGRERRAIVSNQKKTKQTRLKNFLF